MISNLSWRRWALALVLLLVAEPPAQAQGTAFTYQVRLSTRGDPPNRIFDLRFALFDAASGGAQQGNAITNFDTAVASGLFTVTLDCGGQFPDAARWLETAVRANGGTGFTTLLPRQSVAPTPYAIFAGGGNAAGTSGMMSEVNTPPSDWQQSVAAHADRSAAETLAAHSGLDGNRHAGFRRLQFSPPR